MNGTDNLYIIIVSMIRKNKIWKKIDRKIFIKTKNENINKEISIWLSKVYKWNYIKNLSQKYKNIDYYDKTLKYQNSSRKIKLF